jgi:predicted TIM-barrel fold metal-dependent hydrolase
VYGEVLYPTIGMFAFRWLPDSRLVDAMCRSYNDWLAEFCAAQPKRLKGAAMINVDDVAVAVREVQRIATMQFAGVIIPVDPGGGHSYDDPAYEPLWSAVEDAGLPIGTTS